MRSMILLLYYDVYIYYLNYVISRLYLFLPIYDLYYFNYEIKCCWILEFERDTYDIKYYCDRNQIFALWLISSNIAVICLPTKLREKTWLLHHHMVFPTKIIDLEQSGNTIFNKRNQTLMDLSDISTPGHEVNQVENFLKVATTDTS